MYISNFKTYLPNDFIPEIYKKINSDLINLNNDKDIINHYLQEGYFENRIYKINLPDDFIPEIYKKLNNDLENLIPGFSFLNSPCNPCGMLNEKADYSCKFTLDVKNKLLL